MHNVNISIAINDNAREVSLSTLADTAFYIPLQTTDSTLIARVADLQMTKNYILVCDTKTVFQFTTNGEIVRRIGRTGKGPGEHGSFIRFAVNELVNEVFILSHSNLMNVFDLHTGRLKRSYVVSIPVSRFQSYSQNRIVYFTKEINSRTSLSSIYDVYISDLNGVLVDSFPDYNRKNNRSNSVGFINCFRSDNDAYYISNVRDTLFKVTSNGCKEPYASLNLRNTEDPNELVINPEPGKLFYPNFLSTRGFNFFDNNLLVTIQKGFAIGTPDSIIHFIYNTSSKRTTKVQYILNDIDKSNVPFWPSFVCDKKLIASFDPFTLQNLLGKADTIVMNYHNGSALEGIKQDDNPILLIALKK